MELRHITSFLVLAEELHFGRSAARLHISQPSLSLQLQQLERKVGVTLIARTSHSVRLTPAGEAFRKEARPLLDQLDRAIEAARQAPPEATERLRIGFNFPAGQRVLVPALALMREKHPHVRTSLVQRHTCGQLAELLGGRIDIAFVYGECHADGVTQRPILTLPVVGVCASDHPLAARDDVRWPELAAYRCVLPSTVTSPALHEAVLSAGRRNGVDFSAVDVFDDGDAAVVMVASQQIVIFASSVRAESVGMIGLASLSFVDPVPEVTIYATWHERDENPAVPLFLDAIDQIRGFPASSGNFNAPDKTSLFPAGQADLGGEGGCDAR
jgi:DNA-binding transcriptional LysR family regulator